MPQPIFRSFPFAVKRLKAESTPNRFFDSRSRPQDMRQACGSQLYTLRRSVPVRLAARAFPQARYPRLCRVYQTVPACPSALSRLDRTMYCPNPAHFPIEPCFLRFSCFRRILSVRAAVTAFPPSFLLPDTKAHRSALVRFSYRNRDRESPKCWRHGYALSANSVRYTGKGRIR